MEAKSTGLGMYLSLVSSLGFDDIFGSRQEEWKDRILKKWNESRNFPRKLKKRVRKELQIEWSIACWNPFEI
jgi:hypothetical protein